VAGDVAPGHHVLDPGEVVGLQRLADADRLVGGDIALAEMIGAERDLVADRRAHGGRDLGGECHAALADAGAGAAAGDIPLTILVILVFGRRADQRARRPVEEARRQVELDEGEAHGPALHHDLDIALRRLVARRRRVAIEADLVAIFAAEQLVAGDAIDLADEIHQRDLDGADAAGLAAVAAIALDRLEEVIDVAGILADQEMLEAKRRVGMGAVTHLAEAVDALVRVDPEDRVVAMPDNGRDADIGDLELRGLRHPAHRILDAVGELKGFGGDRHDMSSQTVSFFRGRSGG